MSAGRSVRNAISVEPGLPKIVVSPCRRMTSKAASRTVIPATGRRLPLAGTAAVGAWVISVTPRSRAGSYCAPVSLVFAYRTPGEGVQPVADKPAQSSDFVQSLERGLAVIRAFDAEHRELALSDVARSTGLTRAAARRFLLTLVKLGYVNFSQGRFSLRPRVLELGYAYLSSLSLPEVALPHMEALVAEVNESCSISVLDDTDIVYVARVPTRRIMSITLAVGTRLPAFVTSMGRVLLAGLPDDELAERLERIEVVPLTAHTVTDKDALANDPGNGPPARVRGHRPGARGGAALARGPTSQRLGQRDRGAEPVGARQPRVDGGAPARLPAAGHASRRGDRGRPDGYRGSTRRFVRVA